MKYAINAYVFDTDQLLLMRAGEVIAFRLNEAKLLALLLSEPHKLFSKEEILDKVWAGKVVTEQAVFQNVRNLRALFGEDAIKTFSKKGYQWQLPVTLLADDLPLANPAAVAQLKPKRLFWIPVAASILLVGALVAALLGGWQSNGSTDLPRVALIPLSADSHLTPALVDPLWEALQESAQFQGVVFGAQTIPVDFLRVPQKYFQAISQSAQAPYVFMGKVTRQADGLHIRYLLKSRRNRWQAEHQAATAADLAGLIDAHVGLILNSGLLEIDEQAPQLLAAKLKLLQSQYPQDLNLLQTLLDLQIHSGDTASGLVLARSMQEMAARRQDGLFQAKARLAEARAYIYENLLADAQQPLAEAESGFQALDDWASLAEVEQERIAMAFARQDFMQVKQHLERTLTLVHRTGDRVQEYRLYTWAAVLAHKFNQTDASWHYLDAAEAVLDKHHQAPEFYALIHFYAGMFEQDEGAAEKHYRKVLRLLPADQKWWEWERAQAHLSELLIKQERWQDALSLYANQTLGATEELVVGNIWRAQRDWVKAETHGRRSFEIAKLNGQLQSALDAAVYLLQLDQLQQRPANNFYRQFLLKEAARVPHWIRFNTSAITGLGLALEEPESVSKG